MQNQSNSCDVIVIGGGHAGCEAATAAARMGAATVLVTHRFATLGAMSCNPAIGGLGKGHLVREVDALDGLMGRVADAAGIQFRMLNRRKGPAVRGPRAQADRKLYAAAMQRAIVETANLSVIEGEADELLAANGRVIGIRLADGRELMAGAVVVTTGTFLRGLIHLGEKSWPAGRVDEAPTLGLSKSFERAGFTLGRLKTGTPPRLDGTTIDWSAVEMQPGDDPAEPFSVMTDRITTPQIQCGITRTMPATHDVIRANVHRSPMYSGQIKSSGPRYCPSIEDKVQRFGDRDGHQVFLEPEGLDDATVYPNGLSTSLPTDVQQALLGSIAGLERATITAPGYAVEYDHIDPRALDHRLALAALPGVFCAGQINGTTGYEEAAGQGLVAGLNAAAHACDLAPVQLDRASSYIGVMIDDLVLQGVTEPYRMLTARAEYRLALRADNAETRLGSIAEAAGCLSEPRRRHQDARAAEQRSVREALEAPMTASELAARGATVGQDGARRAIFDWLRFEGVTLDHVLDEPLAASPATVAEIVEDARYAPYLERQAEEIARLRSDERMALPEGLRFDAIPGLSTEMIARLSAARPASLAEASRIRGITPAALSAVLLHSRRLAA